jgi:hypothetical protein
VAQFYYRVGFGEAKLVRDCRRDAFDAAVVLARYIAPDPEGKHPEPADLLDALQASGAPWLIDLCTPQLCEANVLLAEGFARLKASALGRLLPLPLDPARLEDDDTRDAFVDACATFQVDAPIISAPYLEFGSEDDPRLAANLAMLRRIVGAAGQRLAVGFVQVTLDSLNRGLAGRVARRYAETGVTVVFLRVRNLRAESATHKHVRAYQTTVDAFGTAKVGVVADQVGRFGAVAVGCGAVGFSGGTQHFRSVPRQLVPLGGGGGGPKLPVEMPRRWLTVPRDLLPKAFECPVADCAVAGGDRSLDALREHDLHYQRYLAAELGPDLPALIADLRQSGQAQALAWADELERLARRSA